MRWKSWSGPLPGQTLEGLVVSDPIKHSGHLKYYAICVGAYGTYFSLEGSILHELDNVLWDVMEEHENLIEAVADCRKRFSSLQKDINKKKRAENATQS